MKKIKAVLLSTILLLGTFASATTLPMKDKKSSTTDEIRVLLTDDSFVVDQDTSAYVTFMLNKDGEVIVLSVETDNSTVESFVKARLNYQTLSTPLEKGVEYKVPILLKGES